MFLGSKYRTLGGGNGCLGTRHNSPQCVFVSFGAEILIGEKTQKRPQQWHRRMITHTRIALKEMHQTGIKGYLSHNDIIDPWVHRYIIHTLHVAVKKDQPLT